MQLDWAAKALTAVINASRPANAAPIAGREITALLNRQAASRMGIVETDLPGSYRPKYAAETRMVEEDVFEKRDVVRVDPLYENRAVTETRNVFETRDVTETRDITEIRGVFESRAVYEDRELRATRLEGNRSLTPYNTLAQAGIDVGADFSIKVGDGPVAVLKFDQTQRLSVTVNGATQRFTFTSAAGSMRNAIAGALDSIDGLSASFSSAGRLQLETANAQSLTIADVANGLLDFSGSPLAKLGLTAGTTQSAVTGYERVQTGTEQVLVGQETVTIGTETVVVGTENIVVGSETVITGFERVQVGERRSVVGAEQVKVGTVRRSQVGEARIVGLEMDVDKGIGGLTALERLARTSLPAGYIEALFGGVSRAEDEAAAPFGVVGAAYREGGAIGFGDEDKARGAGRSGRADD